MYKIRIILDTKKDVIRTILVDNHLNLEDLHLTIAKSLGFKGQEMASFYRSDEEWTQGEEIPLFNMEEVGEGISMQSCLLEETLPEDWQLKVKNNSVEEYLTIFNSLIPIIDRESLALEAYIYVNDYFKIDKMQAEYNLIYKKICNEI